MFFYNNSMWVLLFLFSGEVGFNADFFSIGCMYASTTPSGRDVSFTRLVEFDLTDRNKHLGAGLGYGWLYSGFYKRYESEYLSLFLCWRGDKSFFKYSPVFTELSFKAGVLLPIDSNLGTPIGFITAQYSIGPVLSINGGYFYSPESCFMNGFRVGFQLTGLRWFNKEKRSIKKVDLWKTPETIDEALNSLGFMKKLLYMLPPSEERNKLLKKVKDINDILSARKVGFNVFAGLISILTGIGYRYYTLEHFSEAYGHLFPEPEEDSLGGCNDFMGAVFLLLAMASDITQACVIGLNAMGCGCVYGLMGTVTGYSTVEGYLVLRLTDKEKNRIKALFTSIKRYVEEYPSSDGGG